MRFTHTDDSGIVTVEMTVNSPYLDEVVTAFKGFLRSVGFELDDLVVEVSSPPPVESFPPAPADRRVSER